MKRALAVMLVATFAVLPAQRARAQDAAAAAAASPSSASASASETDEPSTDERRIVAFVATGVAVASLATGITLGVLAQQEFDCAKDVIACNKNLENKVVGPELFDLQAEIQQKAVLADMAYVFAGASALVAVVGYLQGFVFVDDAQAQPPAAVVPAPAATPAAAAPAAAPAPGASP